MGIQQTCHLKLTFIASTQDIMGVSVGVMDQDCGCDDDVLLKMGVLSDVLQNFFFLLSPLRNVFCKKERKKPLYRYILLEQPHQIS